MDINNVLMKHNESIGNYIYQREEEKDKTVKDIHKFVEKIKNRLIDFGYGNTTFHTADISLLLSIVEEVLKEKASSE